MLPKFFFSISGLLLRVGIPIFLCLTLLPGFVLSAKCQVDVDDSLISPGEIAFLTVDVTTPRALSNLHILLSPTPGNLVRLDKTGGHTKFLDPRQHWKPSFVVEAVNPGEVTIFVDVYDSTGVVCSTKETIRIVPITQNPEPQKPELEILKRPDPNKLKVGEELTITIIVENRGRVEARNIVLEDQVVEKVPIVGETIKKVPRLGRGEKFEMSYRYKPEKIGKYVLPPARVVYSYANNITVEAESIAPLIEVLPKPGEEPPTEPEVGEEGLGSVEAMNMVLKAETAVQRAEKLLEKLLDDGVAVPTAVLVLLDSAHGNLELAKQAHSKGDYKQTVVLSTLSEESANQAYQTLLETSKNEENKKRVAKTLEKARKVLEETNRIVSEPGETWFVSSLEEAQKKLLEAEECYKTGEYLEAEKLAGETIKISSQLLEQHAKRKSAEKRKLSHPGLLLTLLGVSTLIFLARIFAKKRNV